MSTVVTVSDQEVEVYMMNIDEWSDTHSVMSQCSYRKYKLS